MERCGREWPALAADADGFGEIAGDVGERGEEKIAEIVADEAVAGVEAVLKQAAEQGFIFRKSHHAVADVAGREDAVFAAQAAGAAAVIGDRDDGGEIGDGAFGAGELVDAADDEFLEAAKERRKAGAASKSDDAEAAGESFRFGGALFHADSRDGQNRLHPAENNLTQRWQRTARTQGRKSRTG